MRLPGTWVFVRAFSGRRFNALSFLEKWSASGRYTSLGRSRTIMAINFDSGTLGLVGALCFANRVYNLWHQENKTGARLLGMPNALPRARRLDFTSVTGKELAHEKKTQLLARWRLSSWVRRKSGVNAGRAPDFAEAVATSYKSGSERFVG